MILGAVREARGVGAPARDAERKQKLAAALKRLRSARGLSQAKVAQAVGVDIKTIQRMEAGRMMPNFAVIADLAELFGCSLDQIAGNKIDSSVSLLPSPDVLSRLDEIEDRQIASIGQVDQNFAAVEQTLIHLAKLLAERGVLTEADRSRLQRLLRGAQ